MSRLLVAEQWNDFARVVLPPGISTVQRQDMRRAFYAGANGLFHRIILALASDDEPTEEDVQVMRGIEKELADFCVMVREGRA